MQAMELPYSGDSLSMLVVFPDAGRRLEEIEKKLSDRKLRQLTRVMEPRKVQVFLPRFEMTCLGDAFIEERISEPWDESALRGRCG
jgi:serpin B